MTSKLSNFLKSIDPSITIEPVTARVDRAINSFPLNAASENDWESFKSKLAKFFAHAEGAILNLGSARPANREIDWNCCRKILTQEYGPSAGTVAFEMTRNNIEGGFYAVFKAIAKHMIKHYASTEISAKTWHFWNGLSREEKHTACYEYLHKYAHLLPPELTEGSAARIHANLPRVLEQHPWLIIRLRGIGRS